MCSVHCCTPCGWMMVATVALATLRKSSSLATYVAKFALTTLNQYGSHYACVYAQVKDLMSCYILLTVECLPLLPLA